MIKQLLQFFGNLIGIHLTPDNHVTPIFRLGRYHRVQAPGFFWIWPFFEQALPPVKTGIHVGNFIFVEVLSQDNVPFRVEMTVLFNFKPDLALKNAAAQLVRGGDQLLQIIVKDYANQGLRRLIARFRAEELGQARVMTIVERTLTRALIVEMRVLGIAPLKNDGLLIKELVAPDKFKRSILNARRLELILRALAHFPEPGLIREAIQAGLITNLEDLEQASMFFLPTTSSGEAMSLPYFLEAGQLSPRNGRHNPGRL